MKATRADASTAPAATSRRGKARAGKRKGRVVRSPDGPEQLRLYSYLMFNLVQRIDRARREVYAGELLAEAWAV